MLLTRRSNKKRSRGREKRSSRRISFLNLERKGCCLSPASSSVRRRRGSQIWSRPTTSSSASAAAMISNTWGSAAGRKRKRWDAEQNDEQDRENDYEVRAGALRDQSGYSSLRQARGSTDSAFGVRWSRNELYGATNGSGAITV